MKYTAKQKEKLRNEDLELSKSLNELKLYIANCYPKDVVIKDEFLIVESKINNPNFKIVIEENVPQNFSEWKKLKLC
jgi:hypothetical protein